MAKNQHKKDILNLAEAYGSVLTGAREYNKNEEQLNELGPIGAASIGMLAGGMLGGSKKESTSDEEDKTGHLDDKELLAKVEGMGTAGDRLLEAAHKRLNAGQSLTAEERDALGRDAYGKAEKDIAHDKREDFEDIA